MIKIVINVSGVWEDYVDNHPDLVGLSRGEMIKRINRKIEQGEINFGDILLDTEIEIVEESE